MAQLALVYKPAATAEQLYIMERGILSEGVAHVGLKKFADEIGVSRQLVSDSVEERDRKRWAAEWTHVLIVMLTRQGDEIARDIVQRLIGVRAINTQFVVTDVDDEPSPEEEQAIERYAEKVKRRRKRKAIAP